LPGVGLEEPVISGVTGSLIISCYSICFDSGGCRKYREEWGVTAGVCWINEGGFEHEKSIKQVPQAV
jgi:hypothetical protein